MYNSKRRIAAAVSLTVSSDKGHWFCTFIKIAYHFRSRNTFPLLFIFPANNFVGFFVNCINSWRVGCSRLGFSENENKKDQKLILLVEELSVAILF